ncbi:MAG: arabinogalactan endo-beta-1,4-galactanase, partial [Rhodothermaceae bacterium]
MFKLKIILFFLIIVTGFVSAQSNTQNFLVGADISAFQNIEKNNGKYFENGVEKSLLDILKENGFNTVRLRLWHTPSDGSNNLHSTLLMAKRIKEKGFKFLLDFHYSDTWADPGHQTKPLVWKDLSYELLKDSIFSYSKNVLEKLSAQNTVPEFIQIGNEISCGFLWNTGSICGEFNTPEQWNKFAELLNSAIAGVKAGLTNPEAAKIIIHSDKGADNNSCKWFYTNLLNNNAEFDIIGLSYYPWWSGSLENLEFNLNDLAERFGKEIILLETAYPWTLDYYDNTHNPVGNQSQLLSKFSASVEGQTNYLQKISEIVSSVKNNKGKGVFYWAPEWIPVKNYGSSW